MANTSTTIIIVDNSCMRQKAPTVVPGEVHTRVTLVYNIKTIFRLPIYCTAKSTRLFTLKSMSLLRSLKVISSVYFNDRYGSLPVLRRLTRLLLRRPRTCRVLLGSCLGRKVSFPHTERRTVLSCARSPQFTRVLEGPGGVLKVRCLGTVGGLKDEVRPCAVTEHNTRCRSRRLSDSCDSTATVHSLLTCSDSSFGARPMRKGCSRLSFSKVLSRLRGRIPGYYLRLLGSCRGMRCPVSRGSFSLVLGCGLLGGRPRDLIQCISISPRVTFEVTGRLGGFFGCGRFYSLLGAQRLARAQIGQTLLRVVLKAGGTGIRRCVSGNCRVCTHLLNFQGSGTGLLATVSGRDDLPILAGVSRVSSLPRLNRGVLERSVLTSGLCASIIASGFGATFRGRCGRKILGIWVLVETEAIIIENSYSNSWYS